MDESCPQWRQALGVWTLGGLQGAEADALVAHLTTCDACRREAGELTDVAAALQTADPLRAHTVPAPPPPNLGDTVVEQVAAARDSRRRQRRTSWQRLAAAASVVFVVAVVALWWYEPADEVPSEVVVLTDLADGVDADVVVQDRGWGASVNIVASGFDEGAVYAVWVEDRNGDRHSAGTFTGTGDSEITCYMAAATRLADAAVVGIDATDGSQVLRGAVGDEA